MSDEIKDIVMYGLDDLCQRQNKKGWDQPPSIWVMQRMRHPTDETGWIITFMELPTYGILTMAHPSDALAMIAQVAASGTMPMPEFPNFFGMLFSCESWSVHADGPEQKEAMLAEARKRNLHEHPDRVECRMLSAVDIAGFHYAVMYTRDDVKPPMRTAGRPGEDFDGALSIDGFVFDSLHKLVEAFTLEPTL